MANMALPPSISDMIEILRDRSVPRFQRDNTASNLQNVLESVTQALAAYDRETRRADRR